MTRPTAFFCPHLGLPPLISVRDFVVRLCQTENLLELAPKRRAAAKSNPTWHIVRDARLSSPIYAAMLKTVQRLAPDAGGGPTLVDDQFCRADADAPEPAGRALSSRIASVREHRCLGQGKAALGRATALRHSVAPPVQRRSRTQATRPRPATMSRRQGRRG